jgi:hypothetical protein
MWWSIFFPGVLIVWLLLTLSWLSDKYKRFVTNSATMHGRVKVKTTEQQDREKKLERDAKLASYRKVQRRSQFCSDTGSGAFLSPGSGSWKSFPGFWVANPNLWKLGKNFWSIGSKKLWYVFKNKIVLNFVQFMATKKSKTIFFLIFCCG